MCRSVLALLLLIVLGAAESPAQIFAGSSERRSARTGWGLDVAVQLAQPVGEFSDHVDAAIGVGSSLRHAFAWFPPLALRADFAMMNYGSERQRVPLSSSINRVTVDMTTHNNILVVGGGPELGRRRGMLRPYVHAFVGYSYFFTESSVGDDNGGVFARSTNFDDGGLALGVGGGVRMPLRTEHHEIALDAGARHTRNGMRSYLRRGDIIDQPDGSLAFTPRVTDADFWTYSLGFSVSFGRRR